jgi:hypothetical protein
LGAGDTFVVGTTDGATVIDGDGATVDFSVGLEGETTVVGDPAGWHPTTAEAARLITRSIRITWSVSDELGLSESHLKRSKY